MAEPEVPTINPIPFFIADLLLLALAVGIVFTHEPPVNAGLMWVVFAAMALGGCFSVWPFLKRYQAEIKLAETRGLTNAMEQIRQLEKVGKVITETSGILEQFQDQEKQTLAAAKNMTDQFSREAKAFQEFLEKANDSEKQHLRLETEKLRRAESEWLQVVVHMLDHVHALHAAGMRSGQPNLINQLSQFQAACRDTARRVGLVPFSPEPGDPFEESKHLVNHEGEELSLPDYREIAESLAVGYLFQGRLLRKALVKVHSTAAEPARKESSSTQGATAHDGPQQTGSEPEDLLESGLPEAAEEEELSQVEGEVYPMDPIEKPDTPASSHQTSSPKRRGQRSQYSSDDPELFA